MKYQENVPITLDSGAGVDLVSIDFMHELGLEPCKRHCHNIPDIYGVGKAQVPQFGIYHLRVNLTDCFEKEVEFIRPFLAVERDSEETKLLIGMATLQNLRVLIDTETRTFEFKTTPKVQVCSARVFQKQITSKARVYGILPVPNLDSLLPPAEKKRRIIEYGNLPLWIRKRFPDIFDTSNRGAGRLPSHRETDHAIELKENTKLSYSKIYNMSPAELKTLEEYIRESLEKGIIQESKSPIGAPVLFVPKKNGKLRLCVDYRALNEATVKNRYPLPLISELLDRLNGSVVFSKIDLKNAYYRIRIREGDEWKTAFRTRYGHFEYLVMPFGLTNAPATFQSYINRALRGLVDDFCVVYLDDILIFSRSQEEHDGHIAEVLQRLREHELYAQPGKCSFYQEEIEFLGFVINSKGVKMDPVRVNTIKEWKPPSTYRDLQVFLGFCNFYRRFIKDFSNIAQPLHNLLRGLQRGRKPGKIDNEWQDAQEEAFQILIQAFQEAPILRHYDPERKLRLETDASHFAVGCILSQYFDDDDQKYGNWHPIAFYSRKFSGAELNYSTPDKELMAIVIAFEHWRHYLEGAQDTIEVWSDHQNIQAFVKQPTLNGRQARWLIKLMPYDFVVHYRKGKSNPADGPSRRPDYRNTEIDDSENQLLPTFQAKLCRAQAIRTQLRSEIFETPMSRSPPSEYATPVGRSPSPSPDKMAMLPESVQSSPGRRTPVVPISAVQPTSGVCSTQLRRHIQGVWPSSMVQSTSPSMLGKDPDERISVAPQTLSPDSGKDHPVRRTLVVPTSIVVTGFTVYLGSAVYFAFLYCSGPHSNPPRRNYPMGDASGG